MKAFQKAHSLALLLPSGLLGGALIGQFAFGLYPCEMCMWQRWPHLAAIALGLIALLFRKQKFGELLVLTAAIAILLSGLIGGFHAGVEYDWWEGLTSCATTLGSGSNLDSIMNAPLVRCDVAPWTLGGISLAGFNFLFSVGGALMILWFLAKSAKESGYVR